MKAILIVAIVVGLLMPSVNAHILPERKIEDITSEEHKKNVKLCTQNLVAIGEAIQAYQQEHDDFPEWLSDLHPEYLADEQVLICPADDVDGKALFPLNVDSKMRVSYGYQFHPEYRARKSEQRLVYGDVIPLVRCRHHANEVYICLNLSFAFKIYKSTSAWETAPEEIYGSHEAAIAAFEDAIAQHPDDKRFSRLYTDLVRLYMKTGNDQAADVLIKRLQSSMKLDLDGYRMLFDVMAEMERYQEMLEIFKEAEQQYPDAQLIHGRLAHIYWKLGNMELSAVYQRKADPTYKLIGKSVPDFTTTDLDGDPISLQDYRGKIVLLDFWAVWCGPCIAEMPNVKKVYDTYKDEGFDVIGVSLDREETTLRDYIKENDIQWRQIFENELDEDSITLRYGIRDIPAPWLIDREGKLITPDARGHDLEQLVVEALKDKSTD